MHRAIAIIPARGGSKRIPRKNLADLAGKPLIVFSILTAEKSKYLKNRIYVSTEDSEITQTAQKHGAKVINRPKKFATDEAGTLDVLKHAVAVLEKEIDFDTVILLQATCPFRKVQTINRGIKKLWDNWNKYKVIFSIKPSKFPPNWLLKKRADLLEFILPNDFSKIRSQDLDQTYEIDGCLYVFKKDWLKKSKLYPFSPNKTGYLIPNKIESLDIDDMEDLQIARMLAKKI